MMKATTMARTFTVGFGCPATDCPHHFSITIRRDRSASVQLTENDGTGAGGWRFVTCLGRATWDAVADTLAGEKNSRLRAINLAPGRWRVGETRIDRTLGKEVAVLMMAAGGRDAGSVPAAIANWKGLAPEERWWLYRKASRSGAWREAVRIALAENPVD